MTGGALTGEVNVFRQEAVAGMDGFGASLRDCGEDGFKGEIALGGGRRADEDGFVGFKDVERVGVGFGVDGDGGDAHAAEGALDASGYSAAIGDKNFFEHKGISQQQGFV